MELATILSFLSPEDKATVQQVVNDIIPDWAPLPGQQTLAYESEADELFYGGAAGGAKSDLLLGLGLTKHIQGIVYRRESTQLEGLTRRLIYDILGNNKGWNDTKHMLRRGGKILEFGSCKDAGDEISYQGRPHDFVGFDEITHFLESQYRFLIGWNRTTRPGQRCRVVCTGNPPTEAEGRWVIQYWAPWLDPQHPNPAQPGELRWFTTIDGKDKELPNSDPVLVEGVMVQPKSRTFIPSKVTDNPFLMATGYMSTLQALPEPLRSQMLKGDFQAGISDDLWQIIPTSWVDAAMKRWTIEGKRGFMTSSGVDVARGGTAETIVSTRYGTWFDELRCFPGSETPNGPITAGLVISVVRDGAPVHIDVVGVGGSPYDHLIENNVQAVPISSASTENLDGQVDKASGRLTFRNWRSLMWWRFREALDPMFNANVDPRAPDYQAPLALPPDPKLKADLCAPRWKPTASGILVEPKEDIVKRLHRSPDRGDAVVYCWVNTPKITPKHAGSDWRKRKPKGSWRTT